MRWEAVAEPPNDSHSLVEVNAVWSERLKRVTCIVNICMWKVKYSSNTGVLRHYVRIQHTMSRGLKCRTRTSSLTLAKLAVNKTHSNISPILLRNSSTWGLFNTYTWGDMNEAGVSICSRSPTCFTLSERNTRTAHEEGNVFLLLSRPHILKTSWHVVCENAHRQDTRSYSTGTRFLMTSYHCFLLLC